MRFASTLLAAVCACLLCLSTQGAPVTIGEGGAALRLDGANGSILSVSDAGGRELMRGGAAGLWSARWADATTVNAAQFAAGPPDRTLTIEVTDGEDEVGAVDAGQDVVEGRQLALGEADAAQEGARLLERGDGYRNHVV